MKAPSSSAEKPKADHVTAAGEKEEEKDATTLQDDPIPVESPSPKKQTKEDDVVNCHPHSSPCLAPAAVLLSEESEKDEQTVVAGSSPNHHPSFLLPSASSDTTLTKSSKSTLLTKTDDDGETFPSPPKRSTTTTSPWWLSLSSSSPEREQVVGTEEWNPSPAKGVSGYRIYAQNHYHLIYFIILHLSFGCCCYRSGHSEAQCKGSMILLS